MTPRTDGERLREALDELAVELVNDHRGIPYDVIERIEAILARAAEAATTAQRARVSEADWEAVEQAIWPDGPAHGHGSGVYATLKARVQAEAALSQERCPDCLLTAEEIGKLHIGAQKAAYIQITKEK
jgi:hypothetical protein